MAPALSKTSLGGLAKFDAALEAVFKRSLAAPAGMDLGFDDDAGAALGEELFGNPLAARASGKLRRRNRDAVLGQQLAGLIFVNIHRLWRIWGPTPQRQPIRGQTAISEANTYWGFLWGTVKRRGGNLGQVLSAPRLAPPRDNNSPVRSFHSFFDGQFVKEQRP